MTRKLMRLAMRVEGNYWNAYVAEMGTMDGAILIGSCAMTAARIPAIKDEFMRLMQSAVEALSPIPVEHWNDPIEAPEHERGGNA